MSTWRRRLANKKCPPRGKARRASPESGKGSVVRPAVKFPRISVRPRRAAATHGGHDRVRLPDSHDVRFNFRGGKWDEKFPIAHFRLPIELHPPAFQWAIGNG